MSEDKTTLKYEYNRSEKVVITLSLILSLMMIYIYVGNRSLKSMFFPKSWIDQSNVPLGKLTQIDGVSGKGNILRQRSEDFEFTSIEKGSDLYPNDSIMTDANSKALIKLENGQEFEVPPSTLIKLDFETSAALGGVVQIQVIQSATLPVTKVEKKKYVKPKPLVSASTPRPLPTATPAPTATPIPVQVLKAIPANGTQYSFTQQEYFQKYKTIRVAAEVNQIKETELHLSFSKSLDNKNFKLKGSLKIPLNKKVISSNLKIDSPGFYLWQVYETAENILLSQRFEVLPNIELITLLPPQKGSNKTDGKSTKKAFEGFNLGWNKVPGSQPYLVKIFQLNQLNPILSKETLSNQLLLNKNNLIHGGMYYTVQKMLDKGFIATSQKKEFSFEFQPPDPVEPQDQKSFEDVLLQKSNGVILFTWSKTNYTNFYEFELSDNPQFTTKIVEKRVTENYVSFSAPKNGIYYWRVRSRTNNLASSYSILRSFKVLRMPKQQTQ